MPEDDWQMMFERMHEAVLSFGRLEVEALARKAIYRLQRIQSSGIFGDDYNFRSLWDEYCHEIQEGPHDALKGAWELTIDQICDGLVEHLPRHSAVLITIYADWELDEQDGSDLVGSVWPDGIRRLVENSLRLQAGVRNLHKLGP